MHQARGGRSVAMVQSACLCKLKEKFADWDWLGCNVEQKCSSESAVSQLRRWKQVSFIVEVLDFKMRKRSQSVLSSIGHLKNALMRQWTAAYLCPHYSSNEKHEPLSSKQWNEKVLQWFKKKAGQVLKIHFFLKYLLSRWLLAFFPIKSALLEVFWEGELVRGTLL